MLEAVSAVGRSGKRRARRAMHIPAMPRARRRGIGGANIARKLFRCASAKRIRISRLDHVFDL
jgi:hypothetical protein